MFTLTMFKVLPFLILALESSSCEGRLRKRNGYHYKSAIQPSTSYETSYEVATSEQAQHALPSGPSAGANNNKYDSGYFEYKISSAKSHPSSSGGKSGYSIGSGLRSIAQGSANQAHSAVANQHAAAKQAAFIAKNTLAQTASQAAATAQAALAGKEVILQELEHQAAEAQRSLSRELVQLKSAQQAASLAKSTAQAAQNHVSILTASVNNAKAVAEHAEQTANEVVNQLASQSSMVGQAKNRLEQVGEQLQQARIDFAATKEAALKASSSAAEAQVNASEAAEHATLGLHESTSHVSNNGRGIGSGHVRDEEDSYDEHIETTAIGHSSIEIPVDRHP